VPVSLVLHHVGPLTRTVEDARVLIAAMQGFDPRCVESCRQPAVPERADRPTGLDGRRMGVLRDFEQEPATPAVDTAFARTIQVAAAVFSLTRCFDEADLLLSPTVPQTANRYGEVPPENAGTYTIPANFTGCPPITLPMGRHEAGLPTGLQIMAPVGRDDALLRAAAAMEAALDGATARRCRARVGRFGATSRHKQKEAG